MDDFVTSFDNNIALNWVSVSDWLDHRRSVREPCPSTIALKVTRPVGFTFPLPIELSMSIDGGCPGRTEIVTDVAALR